MTSHWDEMSKSLADETLPRRESLRRIGAVLAGAVLSPLGLGTALAGGSDPCRAFCNKCPRFYRSRCLTVCRGCNDVGGQLCGSCNNLHCADLQSDFNHCGACLRQCAPGPYEYGACIDGQCEYWCAEGAVRCDGTCTLLKYDPYNCGACGNVCPESTACFGGGCGECPGELVNCGGECVYLSSDHEHCGACFNDCRSFRCVEGVCE